MTYLPPPSRRTTADETSSAGDTWPPGTLRGEPLAGWLRRSCATGIDWVVTVYIPLHIPVIGSVLMVVLVLVNSVYLQARTYQSLGKVVMGLALIRPVDHNEGATMALVGYPRGFARLSLHVLDVMFLGFLRPLWNINHQTFADSITHTAVIVGKPRHRTVAGPGARNVV